MNKIFLKKYYIDLNRNLTEGLRLILFRPFSQENFQASMHQVAILIALGLLVTLIHDFTSTFPEHYFTWYALNAYFAFVFLKLVAAYLATLIIGDNGKFLLILTAGLVIELFFQLSSSILSLLGPVQIIRWYGNYSNSLYWAFALWEFLIIFSLLRPLFPPFQSENALLASITYIIVTLSFSFVSYPMGFWTESSDDDKSSFYSKATGEESLYLQPDLLQKYNESLLPGRPGIRDLYFVGFAGYWYEDVFMYEVKYVQEFFDQSFDTKGRSIALINNEETYESVPLATVTSLRKVLDVLKNKINSEEDILFIYLTSHGSKNHGLSVNAGYYQLDDLTPKLLDDVLDKAGIKWRVIVISACYSGGYIKDLSDEYSLIITASAADKTSFGCGEESDFTYFGDAFFRKALHNTTSFTEAFKLANQMIEDRESEEHKTPSKPQMYLGKRIAKKLDELAYRINSKKSLK